MANEGFSEQVKIGFLYCLLCSDRPINEVISPNFQDQPSAMANQFAGMTDQEFGYTEYEEIRAGLVKTVQENLTERDKQFLLSIKDVSRSTNNWFFIIKLKLRNQVADCRESILEYIKTRANSWHLFAKSAVL